MAQTLYKIEEGKVAPRVPDFLRGKFFELYDPKADQGIYPSDGYVGWILIKDDGTIEIGEPGV